MPRVRVKCKSMGPLLACAGSAWRLSNAASALDWTSEPISHGSLQSSRCPSTRRCRGSPDLVVAVHQDHWRSHQPPQAHLLLRPLTTPRLLGAFREGLMCVRWRFARSLCHIGSHGLRLLAVFRHRFLTLPSLLRLVSDRTESGDALLLDPFDHDPAILIDSSKFGGA